ncbi:MAG: VWA domain-containing protein [Crocinitomicaceae bacterium]|nr:VWA domain-containing protein [Crocinitomicaceae bacterium]
MISTFLIFIGWSISAQITPSETSHDFGDIYEEGQTYVDITFTNNTDKTQFLLTIDKPRDVYYIFSSKKLLPDSSIIIRFKINDGLKGKFNYQVDVYFSDSNTGTPIYLSGNVKEVASNPLTDCPDFNSRPPSGDLNFTLVIKVIDSITREPIPNALVSLVERGELVGQYSTNQKGIVIRNVPLGYYFISAEKNPYYSNFFEGYVNAQRNYVEIELGFTEPEIVYYEEPEILETVYEDEVDTVSIPDPVIVNEIPEDTITEPEIVTIIPPLNDIPDTILDPGYFKFSNITFILDASSSMNSYGKLDLMKMSMIELVKILRPDDNVTVLKYAAEAQVLLEHVSGDKKEEIISVIKGIKTSGSTAGGDAIKVAYALNKQRHLHDGNNLIIMITDGLFNKGSTDYDATIENYFKSDGTRFSVVGIKTTDFVAEHMETIVTKGGGDFIEIQTIHDAQTKLIAEIRRTSYKG